MVGLAGLPVKFRIDIAFWSVPASGTFRWRPPPKKKGLFIIYLIIISYCNKPHPLVAPLGGAPSKVAHLSLIIPPQLLVAPLSGAPQKSLIRLISYLAPWWPL